MTLSFNLLVAVMYIWIFKGLLVKGCVITYQSAAMYFNAFTDVLAGIWSDLYYGSYYFSIVNFKLLFSEDKWRLHTDLLIMYQGNSTWINESKWLFTWLPPPACHFDRAICLFHHVHVILFFTWLTMVRKITWLV